MTPEIRHLLDKWREEADDIEADGDICCALTRRHDADELEAALLALPADLPPHLRNNAENMEQQARLTDGEGEVSDVRRAYVGGHRALRGDGVLLLDVQGDQEAVTDPATKGLASADLPPGEAPGPLPQAYDLIRWALGEMDPFPPLPDDWPARKFYWREELRRRFNALRAAPLPSAEGWQPIETCPPDGLFIVHEDGAIRMMFRTRGEWQATAMALDQWGQSTDLIKVRETGVYQPTHWMPLPAAPVIPHDETGVD